MKNLQLLTSEKEIETFVSSLWRSDEFRRSAEDESGYINGWTKMFSQKPRLVIESSEADVETSHFYSWMNALTLRSYNSPVISDLYYLHELVHMATMDYRPRLPFDAWRAKLVANELLASLESEVVVYFAMPTLRERSFKFEIWADRFLSDKQLLSPDGLANRDFFAQNFASFYRRLKSSRIAVSQLSSAERDPIQQTIAQYSRQNDIWAEIWREQRAAVEDPLYVFAALAEKNRNAAGAFVKDWLEKAAAFDEGVPFREEAELFSVIYHRKKKQDQKVYEASPWPRPPNTLGEKTLAPTLVAQRPTSTKGNPS